MSEAEEQSREALKAAVREVEERARLEQVRSMQYISYKLIGIQ